MEGSDRLSLWRRKAVSPLRRRKRRPRPDDRVRFKRKREGAAAEGQEKADCLGKRKGRPRREWLRGNGYNVKL